MNEGVKQLSVEKGNTNKTTHARAHFTIMGCLGMDK